MKTVLSIVLSFAVLGSCSQESVANDIEDFLRNWQQFRENRSSRQDEFRRYQEQRNQRGYQREGAGQADWEGEVRGYPAGNYTVNLPGDEQFRIRVQPSSQNQDQRNQPSAAAVLQSAKEIQPYVRAINRSVRRVDEGNARELAERTERDVDQLIEAAQRQDMADVKTHHESFDSNWQRLAYALSRYNWEDRMQEYLTRVRDLDHEMHEALEGPSGFGYDRLRLIALSRRLNALTENLEQQLTGDSNRNFNGIPHQARRVSSHARDFVTTVDRTNSRRIIVDEFEQFDDAWHRLADRLDASPAVDRSNLQVRRNIWLIDRQLHDLLLVEAPSVPDSQSVQNLIAQVLEAGHHLEEDLRTTIQNLDREERTVERQAWDVYDALVSFNSTVESLNSNARGDHRHGQRYAQLEEQWQQISAGLAAIPKGHGFRHSRQAAAEIENDLRRLKLSSTDSPNWRYSQHSDTSRAGRGTN